jgi:hypothetical protein
MAQPTDASGGGGGVSAGYSDTSAPFLTMSEWGKLGGFVLLLFGLSLFDKPLATFVGVSALGIIILRGGLIPA